MSAAYVSRLAVDSALAQLLARGTGAIALEGPSGAGKSAALLHALMSERERRNKAGKGFVRLLQIWGDEAPSLFVRRMVREVGFLHLVAYPEPEKLGKLVADMAQAIPGLGGAGKLLGALLPDDMRPLAVVAAQALAEAGARAMDQGGALSNSGPLVLGVDLLGGEVSGPVRDFFSRLIEQLPPTVVMVLAQPGGHSALSTLPATQRLTLGAFSVAEACAFFEQHLGPLDAASIELLSSGQLGLLPGDLAQIVNLYPLLGHELRAGLTQAVALLQRDISARYQSLFESALLRPGVDARLLELCAVVAVTTRPQQPLTLEQALARMPGGELLRPIELAQLRQHPLLRALCASVTPVSSGLSGVESGAHPTVAGGQVGSFGVGLGSEAHDPRLAVSPLQTGWPLLPRSSQAREGILAVLQQQGLLDLYQGRFLRELLAATTEGSGTRGLLAGVQALSLLTERAARDPIALGQALSLLSDLEIPLWRAGWHRAFAELYDALLPHLWRAGVSPRDAAPKLWFRRARARVQGIDWAGQGAGSADHLASAHEELPQAIEELSELCELKEPQVVAARARLGLPISGVEVSTWCVELPYKARQARGYARVLRLLLSSAPPLPPVQHAAMPGSNPAAGKSEPGKSEAWLESLRQTALDDILMALSHFAAAHQSEDIAQTLTILADWYSARTDADADRLACSHYEQAVLTARQLTDEPAFTLGIIYRCQGNHHRRRGRGEAAAQAYTQAKRWLLRSPDARMGTLLAGLIG